MRNLKKVMALILVFALSLTMMASAAYSDVQSGDANEEAIGVLSALGVIKGYTNGEFRPNNNITRAEVSTIIYRLITNDVTTSVTSADTQFPDVPNTHWASGYVKYATALDPAVILGRTSGEFDPEDNVTVAEAATLVVRALGYDNLKTVDEGLAKAYELGLTTIAVGGSKAATRGEVASMCFKALGSAYLRDGKGLTLDKAVFNMTAYNAVVLAAGDTTTIRAIADYENLLTDVIEFYGMGSFINKDIWSLYQNPVLRDATFSYKTSADLFGHGVIAYIVDTNKDGIVNSFDKMIYAVKASYSKTYTYDAENKGYINPAYTMETKPLASLIGNPEFTYVNVNGYATTLADNAALINTFAGSAMYGEYKYIDNDGDGKIEIAYLTMSFNAGQLGNSYDTYGGVEISSLEPVSTTYTDINGNKNIFTGADDKPFYVNAGGNGVIFDTGIEWGGKDTGLRFTNTKGEEVVLGNANLAYYETLLPGRDNAIYTDRNGVHYDGFMSGISRPTVVIDHATGLYSNYYYDFGANAWKKDTAFAWNTNPDVNKITVFNNALVPFARISDWGDAVEGDWVIATPVWTGEVWNYNLEKANTITGICTYSNYQGGLSSIQLDGKEYSPLMSGYMWNYDGYRVTSEDWLVTDVDGDGVYEALDGDVRLSLEYRGSFSDVTYTSGGTIVNNATNLGKSFTLVMNKAGDRFWKAMETPIGSNDEGNKYGIITAVAGTAVNLNASNLFATPDWTVQIQMLDNTGKVNVYNTTTTWVTRTSGMTKTTNPEYEALLAVCGTEFMYYELVDGRLNINESVIDDDWTNVMANTAYRFTFNKATGHLVNNASNIISDVKFGLPADATIFSFDDLNNNGLKDASEEAKYIPYADLAVKNASVYADSTYATPVMNNLYETECVVFINTTGANATTKTNLGICALGQAVSIVDGVVTKWSISFTEITGAKSYTMDAKIAEAMHHPWGAGFLYMYTVNSANEIIAWHEWVGEDFDRQAGLGGLYSMQIANVVYDNALGAQLADVFYEDAAYDAVFGEYTATLRGKFYIDSSTKIRLLGVFGPKNDSWKAAQGSAFNPYYDFEEYYFTRGYNVGWMRYEVNANGDAYITELYLTCK